MADGKKLMSHRLMEEATAQINTHEAARKEIQAEFKATTGRDFETSPHTPTIAYVMALEDKIIRLRKMAKEARGRHRETPPKRPTAPPSTGVRGN